MMAAFRDVTAAIAAIRHTMPRRFSPYHNNVMPLFSLLLRYADTVLMIAYYH